MNITLHGTSVFLKSLAYVSEHFPLYYIDDIFRNIVENKLMNKLEEVNSYHESLIFTHEREKERKLPILDMDVRHHENGTLSGFVHRIFRACSTCL